MIDLLVQTSQHEYDLLDPVEINFFVQTILITVALVYTLLTIQMFQEIFTR